MSNNSVYLPDTAINENIEFNLSSIKLSVIIFITHMPIIINKVNILGAYTTIFQCKSN